ncbi:MAG TPA: hypothetical protein VGC43_03915 [Luteimonas sp.]
MAGPTRPDQDLPERPGVDPRRGRNAGYAEERPKDRGAAQQPAEPPKPSPDEPGIDRDTDAHPSP